MSSLFYILHENYYILLFESFNTYLAHLKIPTIVYQSYLWYNTNMQFKYKEAKIKLRDKEYTICIPDYPFSNLHINIEDNKNISAIVFSSLDDILQLALAFHYYKKCENTILYIQGQKKLPDCLQFEMNGRDDCVDLVLINHKMQFNHKNWKSIRSKIKKRNLINKSYSLNEKSFKTKEYKNYFFQENKDYLDLHLNYNTLFLCGSQPNFTDLAEDCYNLSTCDSVDHGAHVHTLEMIRGTKSEGRFYRDIIFFLFDPEWKKRKSN